MKGKKTGGRRKGTPNKATAEVKAYAQKFSTKAIDALVEIMLHGGVEIARVAAAKEVLDRACGKAPQALTDADGGNLSIPAAIQFVIRKADGADTRK